jgi:hypothetical protein
MSEDTRFDLIALAALAILFSPLIIITVTVCCSLKYAVLK